MTWLLLLVPVLLCVLVLLRLGNRQANSAGVDPSRRRFLRSMLAGAGVAAGMAAGVIPLDSLSGRLEWIHWSAIKRAGYIYVPYVPLFSMPPVMDPAEWTGSSILKRDANGEPVMRSYGNTKIDPRYYGTVLLTDED